MSAKQSAVSHILATAKKSPKGLASGFVEASTGDTLAVYVTNTGEVKVKRRGIWEQIYTQQTMKVKDLRWEELGILLGKCREMGAPYH